MRLAGLGGGLIVQGEWHAAHALGPADLHDNGVSLRPADAQSRRQRGLEQQDQSQNTR